MSTHTFRVANEEDAKSIAALVNSAYRGDSSKKGWTTEADLLGGQRTDEDSIRNAIQCPDSYILCAFENATTMWGCVQLMKDGDSGYLGMFTVDPLKQAGGLGKLLMSEAENFLRAKLRVQRIWMTVIVQRTELIAWYERRGYRRTGEFKPFPYDDVKFGIPKRPDLKMEILEKTFVDEAV
jgi:ribosomal protein S18 acetylase RimI-like enzyme